MAAGKPFLAARSCAGVTLLGLDGFRPAFGDGLDGFEQLTFHRYRQVEPGFALIGKCQSRAGQMQGEDDRGSCVDALEHQKSVEVGGVMLGVPVALFPLEEIGEWIAQTRREVESKNPLMGFAAAIGECSFKEVW
jgi:hypothetical protein